MTTTELLTVKQAAERMNVGERFIRRLVADRRIPFTKLGTHVRIEKAAVDAYIERGRVDASA